MKLKIYFLIISSISIFCLSVSKKNKSNLLKSTQNTNQKLKEKIYRLTKLVPHKPFELQSGNEQNLYQQYMNWTKKLSRSDMLKIIAFQIEHEQGFTKNDGLEFTKILKMKPLSEVYDVFMSYQKKFVLNNNENVELSKKADRLIRLHNVYQTENNNTAFIRRVPVIHNLEVNILPDITNFTDQELYQKIREEMNRIGFSSSEIDQEINNLKKANSSEVQKSFPYLQKELAERLAYFNGTKKNSPEYMVKADYFLGLLHTWTTTAASIAGSSVGFFGLNPFAFQAIAQSTLLNPYISQTQSFSKRQMLAMIYAQYKSFDYLQDSYLNIHFKETDLATKDEILDSMASYLEGLGFSSHEIQNQIKKYKLLDMKILQTIAQELELLSKKYPDFNMTEDEKRIAIATPSELFTKIKEHLAKFKLSEDEKEAFLKNLKDKNVDLMRATLLDLMHAQSKGKDKPEPVFSNKEKALLESPKIISRVISPLAFEHIIRPDWQQAKKSAIYQHWKEKALQESLEQKHETLIEQHAANAYEGFNMLRSVMPF